MAEICKSINDNHSTSISKDLLKISHFARKLVGTQEGTVEEMQSFEY